MVFVIFVILLRLQPNHYFPLPGYFNQLQVTLIGGLRNAYNLATISIFSLSLILISTVHYLRINQKISSETFEETENIPGIIIILGSFLFFWNIFPFLKNSKLRKFSLKTIRLVFEDVFYFLTRLWKMLRKTRKLSSTVDIELQNSG